MIHFFLLYFRPPVRGRRVFYKKVVMKNSKYLKAPFPYFGGKSLIADTVWHYLGNVKTYIEPFFGSGAVLLRRPPTKREKIYEIICDKDGFIANVWRSIIFSPDEVAKWCDWPVNHADLIARRRVLIANEQRLLDGLMSNPDWHDAKLAGYWIWATSCWIGSGPTKGDSLKRPALTCDVGITAAKGKAVYDWMRVLQERLRCVKVVCGDWSRVCGGNWQSMNAPTGIFMDPPYSVSDRRKNIYYHDSLEVAKEVEDWCLKRGDNPNYRIVVAGYDGEHGKLVSNGWRIVEWKAIGGYANSRKNGKNNNRYRERLFISPYCNDENILMKGENYDKIC